MEKTWGVMVAAGLALRAVASAPPPSLTLDERIAMVLRRAPLQHPLTLRWNAQLVPFVEAATDTDLFTGLGLVHAHLRLGQIEVMRRVALGRVAELVGPLALPLDRSLRLFGFRDAAAATAAALPDETRHFIAAFLAGYNHHLLNAPELPLECRLLGIGREPWALEDFLAYARLMAADPHWLSWGRLLRAKRELPPETWGALWQRLLGQGEVAAPASGPLAARAGLGSNSFAVAGSRTASGAALIASDPHLAIGLPNPVLAVGVKSPSFHLAGLMMPGLPFFPIGRNPDMAWGGTNLYAQTSDLVDASTLPIETTSEIFRVRGGRPRRQTLRRSPLGPIVSDGPLLHHDRPLALRWLGHRPGEEIGAMLAAARARTAEDFRAAIGGFGLPGLNITHAGRDGRIGQLRAVHVPRGRARNPADLVLQPGDAWDPAAIAAAGALPSSLDPAEGIVVSANEAPPPGDVPIGHFFAPADRAERIAALLEQRACLSLDDLRRIQRDVTHIPALALRDALLALAGRTPRRGAARALLTLLAAWDGRYDTSSAGAAAFEMLLGQIVSLMTDKRVTASHEALRQSRRLTLEDLRRRPPAPALFDRALARAAKRLRPGIAWGDLHRLRPGHYLAGLPRIGRHFRGPDLPCPGGNDTVAKSAFGLATGRHHVGFGAAARHLSDMADEDANFFCLLGGQDGWFGSAAASDQIAAFMAGESFQLPLRAEAVRASFTAITVIEPL